ncbi:hypothetical protein CRG95_16830 [Escherichia sp. E4208]|nr:hypothetical protein CRI69_01805 [Escherichia sp. E4742]TGB68776.1 hypothetical protein CQB02_03510 [Escherichia coli]TGB71161.1 hypothetical protein CRG96_04335 [Escherichia sp. E4930]TGB82980.1 hypothetical protein CRG95_16830 [Escherichia sp. E4208]TGB94877.1 hypothetical protein CRG94_08355 [Escherichia sp. E3356]TGC00340.1 hypothetical protein CRI63_17735 [Escherichia sp. E2661]
MPLFFTGCCGVCVSAFALIVFSTIFLTHRLSRPACQKGQHVAMLAGQFFFYKSGFLSEMTR